MCEYCGCQAITVIDELTREHDAVVNLIGVARAALTRDDVVAAAAAAGAIAAILGPHTTVEEEGLFPILSGDFGPQVGGLLDEHRAIEAVLAEIDAPEPSDPTWPGRLDTALLVLREHILKEQDGVFPAALTTLSGCDWEAVEAVRRRVGTAAALAERSFRPVRP
jgi:hypothetical protein